MLSGYTNIALFGIDKRATDGGYGNSDTEMIASINNDTKEVRIVSLYRDTYMRVDEDSEGNGIYKKCNAAFNIGGPGKAISMMNTNLDLDIQDYVAVDFSAMSKIVVVWEDWIFLLLIRKLFIQIIIVKALQRKQERVMIPFLYRIQNRKMKRKYMELTI